MSRDLDEDQEVPVTLTVRDWSKISAAVIVADILAGAPDSEPQWVATREAAAKMNDQIIEATS